MSRIFQLFFLLSSTRGFAPHFSTTTTSTTSSALAVNLKDVDVSRVADVEITPEEKKFFNECKVLCAERNLPFENVKNCRDLASPQNSVVKPNRLYRMGRLSDASSRDIELLLNDLGIKTIVDLRSPTELKDDQTLRRDQVFGDFTNLVWKEGRRGGCITELSQEDCPARASVRRPYPRLGQLWKRAETAQEEVLGPELELALEQDMAEEEAAQNECDVCEVGSIPVDQAILNQDRKERHFVSLMNEFKYVRGTVSRVRKRDIARSLLKSPGALVSKRIRSSVKKPFLEKINKGGLPMLNELLLRYGAPGIKYVLEICADKSRHPVAFHCTAGKDRTGMITAIVLSLLGVPDESIVQDYALSANVYAEMNDHKAMVGALSQRNLDAKTFLGAPPEVMRDTLLAIREDYGSVEEYLDWIGFGREKQEQLKEALMS